MKKKLLFVPLLFILASCVDKPISTTSNVIDNSESINDSMESLKESSKESIINREIILNPSSFLETKELINNPGEGFYETYPIKLTRNGVINNIDWLNEAKTYHVRVGISDLKNVEKLSDVTLNSLDSFLSSLEKQGARIIIRFAYDDFEGIKDREPSVDMIQEHISSLGPILEKHHNLIEAVECGLIGPWGEMHTSKLAKQETYNKLIPCWLKATKNLNILLRRPEFIYKYMGYTLDNLDSFVLKDEYKRLGVFNDGYLGTDLDTGTYTDRTKETNFMSKLITPYGGEVIDRGSDYINLPDLILNEQYKTGLSYLNSEYDDSVILMWKNSNITINNQTFTKYNYMNNHMGLGLRFIDMKSYTVDNSSMIKISLSKEGFKKYNNDLLYKLILKSDDNLYTFDGLLDKFDIDFDIENIESSTYQIYLKLYNDKYSSYQLLNNEFNGSKENYLGTITIK